MNFDYLFIYFIIMSFIGYIYETTAVMIWDGKWENRGFLYGPIIPIYGCGSLIGLIICNYILDSYSPLLIFGAGVFFSALLEYPTSYILEKLFHAIWWDYSNAPLNINGRISLFTSLGFGFAGLVVVYLINPVVVPFVLGMSQSLAGIISRILMCIMTADLTLTVSILSGFEKRINTLDKLINEHMENAVETVNPKGKKLKKVFVDGVDNIEKRIDNATESMGYFYHGAIRRVKKFKHVGSDRIVNLKNEIKIRIDNIRKKDER